jgi:hypothetical protein
LTEGNILEGNFWPEPVRVNALKWQSGIEYPEWYGRKWQKE